MKISHFSHWSNHTHKREVSHDLDEKAVQRRKLAKRILNESVSKLKHDNHRDIDPLADFLPHDQSFLADSVDASLFRKKLQLKKSDSLKHLHDYDNLNEIFDKPSEEPVLPFSAVRPDRYSYNNQSWSNDKSENAKFNLESIATKAGNVEHSHAVQIEKNQTDINSSAADIIKKMFDMGSLIGSGKSNSAIIQLQKELDELVSLLSSYENIGKEVSIFEKENIESCVDFLEGYCEASKLGEDDRIKFNEQFNLLRASLNFNVQTISTVIQNSQAQIDSPISITNVRAKAAQLSLNKAVDHNFSESSAAFEKNRRLISSQKEDKKQSEDTLALKVQRSV